LGTGGVTDNGTLAYDRNNTLTEPNLAISGTGVVEQIGTGTTILTGANNYQGGTTISSGTLQVGDGTTSDGGIGTGPVSDNSALNFDPYSPSTSTISNTISGTGTVSQIGPGTTILTGSNNYSGGTTISSGVLQVGNGGGTGNLGTGGVTDNADLVYDRNNTLTENNVITGTGEVEQIGSGTTILTSTSNSYTGLTEIDGGILNVASLANGGSNSSIGASSNAASNLVFGGGTLQYSGTTAQTTDRLFTIGDANGNTANLNAAGTGAGTVSFTNTGAIVYGTTGVAHGLTLSGANTGNNLFAPLLTNDASGDPTSLTKSGTGMATSSVERGQ
jgi:fibronectin-binding autotransporter adhesin